MKKMISMALGCLMLLATSCLVPIIGQAATLEWNRNAETDMSKYHVYMCKVKGCTATDAGLLWVASVNQPAVGVKPSWKIPDNLEGALAVSAEDQSKNISKASASLPFSSMGTMIPPVVDLPPAAPGGLTVKPLP